jgi:hypothetical protein
MTDNGLAALAAALPDDFGPFWDEEPISEPDDHGIRAYRADLNRERFAAAILGERGVFLPDGAPDYGLAAHDDAWATMDAQAATIATLRAAMDGLVEPLGEWLIEMMERNLTPAEATLYDALRAALATAKEAGG